jgi:hypothetical protein
MVEFTCDNCGKKDEGDGGHGSSKSVRWWEPRGWESRWLRVDTGALNYVAVVACSKACMEALEVKTDLELLAI